MSPDQQFVRLPEFERWIPLAKSVVRQSLDLRWNDVLEIYSYIPTIPLAEALAMEARRAGSDRHITLMYSPRPKATIEIPKSWNPRKFITKACGASTAPSSLIY